MTPTRTRRRRRRALPGAGKTTLLHRATAAPGVVALDAADVAALLRRAPVPYRALHEERFA